MTREEWEEIVDKVIGDHPDPLPIVNESRKKLFIGLFDDYMEKYEEGVMTDE